MADSKEDIAEHETSPSRNGTKKKRHCKRFWWVYLVVFVAVVILVVCLV
jgi:cell division septal protein FtsQ